jgi:hypothetical protein
VPELVPPNSRPYPAHGGTYVESPDGTGWECIQEPAKAHCAGVNALASDIVEQPATED